MPIEVKSVYLAASYLKMERIASQCAAHLLESLTPESCLDIRSLPGITQNETFVKQVDAYIRQNVSRSREPIDNCTRRQVYSCVR